MNKWIQRALVVLLVLLCILPVVSGAAEYRVGDTIWTTGAKPTADTEQYSRWIPVIRSDGSQEYREAGITGAYEYQWIVEEYYGPGEKKGIPTSFATMLHTILCLCGKKCGYLGKAYGGHGVYPV